VPIVYQVMKSLGHSTMAISEVVLPYLENDKDRSWVAPMQSYLAQMKSARTGIDAVAMPEDWRPASRAILDNNIEYMEDSLKRGVINLDALQAFAKKQGPDLKKVVNWAASTQVTHWMGVLDGWKQQLGPDFDKAYAASNTIYVARQNNVLFSVLAQYFGPDAMNDRLMLIETVSFTTTPEDMLTAMTRIIASDGLRADGRRRAQDHHRGNEETRQRAVPAARRAVRFQTMADADHPGPWRRFARRSQIA
jgi:hypothetical protein